MRFTILLTWFFLTGQVALAQEAGEVVEYQNDGVTVHRKYRLDAEGRRTGAYLEYHANGELAIKATYRAGELSGSYTSRFEDGTLHVSTSYKEGALHGKYLENFEDGSTFLRAKYSKGELDGKREVHEAGNRKPVSIQEWDEGRLRMLEGISVFGRTREEIRSGLAAIDALGTDPPERSRGRAKSGEERVKEPPDDPLWAQRMAALRHLQKYRYLCDVPFEGMYLEPLYNAHCDAAARLCTVIGRLDHTPPNPGLPPADYQFAYQGASRSNLSGGASMLHSVDSYMDDSDPSNIDRVGHRRWCLNPTMLKTGFGTSERFSAMWSMDKSRTGSRLDHPVRYPAAGFFPTRFFHDGYAWSVSSGHGWLAGARKEDVEVRVFALDDNYARRGAALELDSVNLAQPSYGTGGVIIFRPVHAVVRDGARYWVEIAPREPGRSRQPEAYLVEFFAMEGN